MSVGLRRFMPYGPLEFLRGPIGEWVVLILICGLFIAISNAILAKRFGKQAGKVSGFIGIIMGVGLYLMKDTLNFSLEAFGFFSYFVLIIFMFIIGYGLVKQDVDKAMALSVTYCMVFLSLMYISPGIFDTFAATTPWMNGLLFLTFIIALISIFAKLGVSMVKTPGTSVSRKAAAAILKPEKAIDQESVTPEQEKQLVKIGKAFNIRKPTLKSVLQLQKHYNDIIKELEALNGWMDDETSDATTSTLKQVSKTKPVMKKGYDRMTKTILQYKEENPKLYPAMVKNAEQLKGELHDFYLNVDKGMEQIKDAKIRPGLPILKEAQKNIAAAVQTIQRIRENQFQEIGKDKLWEKG